MKLKDQYVVITHDYAVAAAAAMIKANPDLRFCFVSGHSADPTEKHRSCSRVSRAARSARFAAPIAAVMGLFIRDFSVECDQLARCLLGVAKRGADRPLLDNRTIIDWRANP